MLQFRTSSALEFLRQVGKLVRSGRTPEVGDIGVRTRRLIAGLAAVVILAVAAPEALAQSVCPPGTTGVPPNCKRPCPLGTIGDWPMCKPLCPRGQVWNSAGQCVPIICPRGTVHDQQGQCVKVCPPGQHLSNGNCVGEPGPCPLGTIKFPDGTCKPTLNQPSGQSNVQ